MTSDHHWLVDYDLRVPVDLTQLWSVRVKIELDIWAFDLVWLKAIINIIEEVW